MPSAESEVFRFLRRDDSTKAVEAYEYTRHVVGAKRSPTCATYAMQQTGLDNKNFYPLASKAIEKNSTRMTSQSLLTQKRKVYSSIN